MRFNNGDRKYLILVLIFVILCNQSIQFASGSSIVLEIDRARNSSDILLLNNGTYFEYSLIVNTIHYVNGSFGVFNVDNPVTIRNHIEIVDVLSDRAILNVKYSCDEIGVLDVNSSSSITVEMDANCQFSVDDDINDMSGIFRLFGDEKWENGAVVTVASCNNNKLKGVKSYNKGELKKSPQGYQEAYYVTASGTSKLGETKSSTYYYDESTGVLLQIRGSPCDYFILNLVNIDWVWGGIYLTDTNFNLGPQQYTSQNQLIVNPYSLIVPVAVVGFAGIGMYKMRLERKARLQRKKNRGPQRARKSKRKKRHR